MPTKQHEQRPQQGNCHGRPQEGARGGYLTTLDFDINFSDIITVAPRVEIQMHFWKGSKFAGSVKTSNDQNDFSFRAPLLGALPLDPAGGSAPIPPL